MPSRRSSAPTHFQDDLFVAGVVAPEPTPAVDVSGEEEARQKLVLVHQRLCREYGCPVGYFHELSPLDELVSSLLSHRTRNSESGAAYKELRKRFPDWIAVRDAPTADVQDAIKTCNWPEQKAPRIQQILRLVTERRGGDLSLDFLEHVSIREARDWLEELPGVGPKTSAAVLIFSRLRRRALPVDSHHHRVAQRLGLIPQSLDVGPAHAVLEAMLPPEWDAQTVYDDHEILMFHGQRCCFFRGPECERCVLLDLCPSGQTRLRQTDGQAKPGKKPPWPPSRKFDEPERSRETNPISKMNRNDPDPLSTGSADNAASALDRRRFFQRAGLAWAGAAVGGSLLGTAVAQAQDHEISPVPAKEGEKVVEEIPPLEQEDHPSGIPRRRFGKTDEWISIMGIGGFSIGAETTPEAEGIAIVQEAVDNGLNFCDNAWEYNKHVSEERMGKALNAEGRRDKVFLMSKVCTHGRDAKVAMQMLDDTLKRLQTDHLDLWQIHECVYWNDPERHFMKGGVVEALTEAKKQGKVRYVGFTGHKDPAIHLAMLAYDYPFDTVQMPLNAFDGTFHSFEQRVLPELHRRGIMPLGMKSLNGNARAQQAHVVSVEESLRYAMSLPVLTTISGMEHLPEMRENMEIARNFKPYSHDEMAALRARYLNNVASDGRYELYKTTNSFDAEEGRAQHDFPGQYEKVT